jgi:phosphoserine phosphatase
LIGVHVKLLVLDLEGTLFRTTVRLPGTSIDSTIWQGIANALGPAAIAEEVRTHERWNRGDYRSYLDWMKDTIRIHQEHRLTATLFSRLIASAEYNETVPETLAAIDRQKYELLLISGGFRELAARAQLDFGIRHVFAACEYMFDNEGLLSGYNLLPCDFNGKIDFINLMLREYGLTDKDWLFVGDGANDVPIASAAPISIAYSAHDKLRSVATHCIERFSDLLKVVPELRR